MMIGKKDIRFTCGDDNSSVVFAYDAVEMDATEMFMQWVRFMNAIGYVLDPQEMEEMWNGIPSEEEKIPFEDTVRWIHPVGGSRTTTPNEKKIPSEDVTRWVIAELEHQLSKQEIDYSNCPSFCKAVDATIREMNNRLPVEYGVFA